MESIFKGLHHRCFAVNLHKFFRADFLYNTFGRLLPIRQLLCRLDSFIMIFCVAGFKGASADGQGRNAAM